MELRVLLPLCPNLPPASGCPRHRDHREPSARWRVGQGLPPPRRRVNGRIGRRSPRPGARGGDSKGRLGAPGAANVRRDQPRGMRSSSVVGRRASRLSVGSLAWSRSPRSRAGVDGPRYRRGSSSCGGCPASLPLFQGVAGWEESVGSAMVCLRFTWVETEAWRIGRGPLVHQDRPCDGSLPRHIGCLRSRFALRLTRRNAPELTHGVFVRSDPYRSSCRQWVR
jgi:hypothetical protein